MWYDMRRLNKLRFVLNVVTFVLCILLLVIRFLRPGILLLPIMSSSILLLIIFELIINKKMNNKMTMHWVLFSLFLLITALDFILFFGFVE